MSEEDLNQIELLLDEPYKQPDDEQPPDAEPEHVEDMFARQEAAAIPATEKPLPARPNTKVLKANELPDGLTRMFMTNDKASGQFFYRDRNNKLAFVDKGGKMMTEEASPEVVKSMIELCRCKGWNTINIKGSEEFRREAWLQGRLNGIEVKGYTPKPADITRLEEAQTMAMKNQLTPTDPTPQAPAADAPQASKPPQSQYGVTIAEIARRNGAKKDVVVSIQLEADRFAQMLEQAGVKIPKPRIYDFRAPSRGAHRKTPAIATQQQIDQPIPQRAPHR